MKPFLLFSFLCEVRSLHIYVGAQCELQSFGWFLTKRVIGCADMLQVQIKRKLFILLCHFFDLAFLIAGLPILLGVF